MVKRYCSESHSPCMSLWLLPLIVVLLFFFSIGSDEVKRNQRVIKRDYRSLVQLVEGSHAQVLFFSIPPVAGINIERNRRIQLISTLFQGCSHWYSFGFLDHGKVYMTPGLPTPDSNQLSLSGKKIFAQELAELIGRTLKQIWRGKGTKTGTPVISYGIV